MSESDKMFKLHRVLYPELSRILNGAPGPVHIRDIRQTIRRNFPALCNGAAVPCAICEHRHPRWQHEVETYLIRLKLVDRAVESANGQYWAAPGKEKAGQQESVPRIPAHDQIQDMLYEIGLMQAKVSAKGYPIGGVRLDVAWREIVGDSPLNMWQVFEVQLGGNLNHALAKLEQAWSNRRCDLYLVTTERYKQRALEWANGLSAEMQGYFNVVDCEKVKELYQALRKTWSLKAELRIPG